MNRHRAYPGLVKLAMRQGLSASRAEVRGNVLTDHQHNVIDGILLALIASALIWAALIVLA